MPFAQQVLLEDFFVARLRRLNSHPHPRSARRRCDLLLAHLPNPILTILTLVWCFAACLLFLGYRNLYPLALAHAIFGIAVAVTLPGPVIRNMRVGLGYLASRPITVTGFIHLAERSVGAPIASREVL
jgi:hypothetical protein